eukprot:365026-Chlamydomonas_euryale.AAC.2
MSTHAHSTTDGHGASMSTHAHSPRDGHGASMPTHAHSSTDGHGASMRLELSRPAAAAAAACNGRTPRAEPIRTQPTP